MQVDCRGEPTCSPTFRTAAIVTGRTSNLIQASSLGPNALFKPLRLNQIPALIRAFGKLASLLVRDSLPVGRQVISDGI